MFVLGIGDKVRGDASAGTVVDYTIHGLSGAVLTLLGNGQLAAAIGDLVLASAITVVSAVVLVNTDSSARTVNLYLTPSGGTARRLIPKDLSLGVGYSLHFDGAKVSMLDTEGQLLTTVETPISDTVYGAGWNGVVNVAPSKNAVYDEMETKLANLAEDTTPQLGGDLEYNEKNQVFGTSLTSDDTAEGDIITVTFGESIVFGDLCYPDGTENEWMKALGTNAAVKQPAMGVALETKANGESGKLLLRGLIRDATHFSGFALGDILFLSDASAGAWLNAAPTDSGDIVQILGWVLAANYAYFNPDYTYVEIT